MTKPYIVITTINKPTEAVIKFAALNDYKLIVVGDRKTPPGWQVQNVEYLAVDDERCNKYQLNEILPFNHYSRKMLGYLHAIAAGAENIIDTDDDNIPKVDWQFPPYNGIQDTTDEDMGFINVYQYYTSQKIWPRGLPLRLINTNFNFNKKVKKTTASVGIWQGLADEDPDVDAIYRLTDNRLCIFEEKGPLVLAKGTLSPFNTQNTIICKELFPLMYLPTYVTFRFTDILRGLIAQPIMWQNQYQLGFINATVIQKRNVHDFYQDFISEIPMYEFTDKVMEITNASIKTGESIADSLVSVYEGLLKNSIVKKEEIKTLEAWLKDIEKLQNV